MTGELRKYLVHVELADASLERVKEAGAAVGGTLKEIGKEVCPAYRSLSLDMFGFFVLTHLVPGQIRSALDTPPLHGRRPSSWYKTSAFRTGDRLLIVDVGSDALSISKDEAARWLQRR